MRLAITSRSSADRLECCADVVPSGCIIVVADTSPGFRCDIRLTLDQLEKLTAAAREQADAPTVVLPAGN